MDESFTIIYNMHLQDRLNFHFMATSVIKVTAIIANTKNRFEKELWGYSPGRLLLIFNS